MPERPETLDRYLWLVEHRRMVLAVVTGTIGLIAIGLGWWGVTNTTVVADQLAYIASGSVLGIFLLGVASMSYWAEQRERELSRLTEIEVYLGAMAEMLGLTAPDAEDAEDTDDRRDGARSGDRPAGRSSIDLNEVVRAPKRRSTAATRARNSAS